MRACVRAYIRTYVHTYTYIHTFTVAYILTHLHLHYIVEPLFSKLVLNFKDPAAPMAVPRVGCHVFETGGVCSSELQPNTQSPFTRSVHRVEVEVATADALDRRRWKCDLFASPARQC